MIAPRTRLAVAAVLLFGWLAVLGYSAATKSRGPVVSRAQAAVATRVFVAKVEADADGRPKTAARVVESRTADGPAAGTAIEVTNLPDAEGFMGDGEYLLLLTRPGAGQYRVAGLPRSPGYEVMPEKLFIYPWAPGVAAQVEALFGPQP